MKAAPNRKLNRHGRPIGRPPKNPPPAPPAAEYVLASDLVPWKKNPKSHTPASIAKVAASITAFGFGAPVLARRENNELIAGHRRVQAAISLGMTHVPVRFLDLDEEKSHILAIADNRLNEDTVTDDALLAAAIADILSNNPLAALSSTGYDDAELAKLLAPPTVPASPESGTQPRPRAPAGGSPPAGRSLIEHGDVIDILQAYPANHFDAVVCDPPYGLEFMGKKWDYDVPSTALWQAVLRVLKPGAPVIAFGGTRTYHRMVVSMEDAGFEIRDQLAWLYGCLSDDTEILVDGEWTHYAQATTGRYTLCFDARTDEYSWQPIGQLFVYPYDDTAYRIHSNSTDQVVSRNHRCLVERGGAYVFELAEDAALEREIRVPVLENLPDLLCALRLPHEGAGRAEVDVRSNMLGARHRTEGEGPSVHSAPSAHCPLRSVREDNYTPGLSHHEGQQADVLAALQRDPPRRRMGRTRPQGTSCMEGLVSASLEDAHDRSDESGVEGRRYDFQGARELCGSSVRPLSNPVALDGAAGWVCDGAPSIRGAGNRASALAHRNSAPREPRPEGQPTRESRPLQDEQRPQEVRASRFTRSDLARIDPVHYRGIVWCVSVPTGAFVARRNGKVFVTGNSGFPKSHDVSKAIDEHYGDTPNRPIRSSYKATGTAARSQASGGASSFGPSAADPNTSDVDPDARIYQTTGASPASIPFDGYGTALKPAFEPAVLARKPLEGTIAENVLAHGVGGLAIDASRIGVSGGGGNGYGALYNGLGTEAGATIPGLAYGRPLVISKADKSKNAFGDGLNGSVAAGITDMGRFPANVFLDPAAAQLLDEQSGERPGMSGGGKHSPSSTPGMFGAIDGNDSHIRGDTGGASRFFYVAKASRRERTLGVDNNPHPTVKPASLSRYLSKLLLPPPHPPTPRRLLVPFSGSGSEVIGGLLAGWDEVVGVERDPQYVQIARERIAYAMKNPDDYDEKES